ncbi:MAG: hypothetical protein ACE5KV_04690 [Thermoplasmata archaeon]
MGAALGAVGTVNPPLGAGLWNAYKLYQAGKSASRIINEIRRSRNLRRTLAKESSKAVLTRQINETIDDHTLSKMLPESTQDMSLARIVFTNALISSATEARRATIGEIISYSVDTLSGD